MRRDRKLAVLVLALAVVVAAVYATGAFTSMTASRNADVRVAGDGSAFLALEPSEGPNGEFASYGPNGALQVTMGGGSGGPTGVNPDSQTVFRNVFTITNKGSQPVNVWLTGDSEAVTFIRPDGTSLEGKAGAARLRPGGRSLSVGIIIKAGGVKPGANLLESVTIHTDTGVSNAPAQGSHRDTSTSGGESRWPLPTSGGVPGLLGDDRFYAAGPVGQSDCDLGGATTTVLSSLVPFGGLLTEDKNDCTGSSDSSGDSEDENGGESDGSLDEVKDAFVKVGTAAIPGGEIGVWAAQNPKKARKVGKGSVYGEAGMPGGGAFKPNCEKPTCVSRKTASSPYYLIGWMVVGIVPIVDIAADGRDFLQNLASGDYGEAALDGAAIFPVFGKFADIGQLVKYSNNWVSEFPRKADDAIQPIAKHVLPQLTDKDALRLLDVFTKGKATRLHEQGVSVDKIIRYAKKGKLDRLGRKSGGNAGNSKRLVTDGGTNIKKALNSKMKKINGNLGNQVNKPITSADVVQTEIRDPDGDLLVLLNTGKFKNTQKHLQKGPGLRHIVAKHIDSSNPHFGNFPVKPGTVSEGTKFPNHMNKKELINIIKIAAKKGYVPDPKSDPAKIIYSGSKLQKYGIERMKVIRDPDTGMIITAYPTKLTDSKS